MKTLATLNEKIVQRERIDLAGQSSTTIAIVLFTLFAGLSITGGYTILVTQGFSLLFFSAVAFSLVGLAYMLSMIWRLIGSAYIKGEMLIVKYQFGKFKVTELRSVRRVKTTRFMGMRLTSIRFKIDGDLHKVIIFGSTHTIRNPKTIIDTALKVA
jgi:hypothetical protein